MFRAPENEDGIIRAHRSESTLQKERLRRLIIPYLIDPMSNVNLLTFKQKSIQDVLKLFQEWKAVNCKVSRDIAFEQNVCYNVARMCYSWRERNTEVVEVVLKAIYECDQNFCFLFPAHFSCFSDSMVSEWRILRFYSGLDKSSRNTHVQEYFLRHANKCRLKFDNNHFIDVSLPKPYYLSPAKMSVIFVQSNLLLLLLQYGATLSTRDMIALAQLLFYLWLSFCYYDQQNTAILTQFEYFCIFNQTFWGNSNGLSEEYLDHILSEHSVTDILDCADILLRVCPQVQPKSITFSLLGVNLVEDLQRVLNGLDPSDFQVQSCVQFIQNLQAMAVTPAQLCHLARCVIRSQLKKTWNLPDGILMLPIPKKLQAYLNLKFN